MLPSLFTAQATARTQYNNDDEHVLGHVARRPTIASKRAGQGTMHAVRDRRLSIDDDREAREAGRLSDTYAACRRLIFRRKAHEVYDTTMRPHFFRSKNSFTPACRHGRGRWPRSDALGDFERAHHCRRHFLFSHAYFYANFWQCYRRPILNSVIKQAKISSPHGVDFSMPPMPR